MKFSIKIALYYFFFKEFAAYVVANNTHLGVSDDQSTELEGKWTNFFGKMNAYTDPTTYGPASNSDINGAYNDCVLFTEGMRGSVKSNPSVILTGIDRLALDIPVEKARRGHIPVPTGSPNMTLISKSSLTAKIFAMDPEHPAKTGKPKDVFNVGNKMVITGADDPAPSATAFVNQIPEKKTIFEKFFVSENVGKRLWIKGYYLNARNEPGPDGEAFSFIIE